jgi:hypothetical protein
LSFPERCLNTGVNTSKLVAYAVLSPAVGVDVSKLVAYAALAPPVGVDIAKLVAYAVLDAPVNVPPVWTNFTFAPGVVGIAYSQQWDLTPASATTTFSVVTGSLPPGLSLTSPNGDLGVISGTPTTAGTYSFTLRATNAYGTADKAFSITISAAPSSGGSWGWVE